MERKLELYRKAQTFGRNASFVANVILTGHGRPTTKLDADRHAKQTTLPLSAEGNN